MANSEEIKQKTRAFIERFFKNHEVRDDDDFFALGFVNSLFAIQLVSFVEKQFHITIDSDDLDIKNFRSIDAIADLVLRRTDSST